MNEVSIAVSLLASIVALLAVLFVAAVFALLFVPWMRAFMSGGRMDIQLLGMRLRGTPPALIVDALVMLVHRGYSR